MSGEGTLALSWGPWGGFYVYSGYCKRLCLGWFAVTYIPEEIDDLMAAAQPRRVAQTSAATVLKATGHTPVTNTPESRPDGE